MSATVFISHDNRDKPLLAPYIRALHAAGFTLFVDRPDEVGLDPEDARVRKIMMDEEFRGRLSRELKTVDIVLLCLTAISVEKLQTNNILTKEVNDADSLGKLRIMLVAEDEPAAVAVQRRFPELWNPVQHLKLLGADIERLAEDAQFRSLCTQLAQPIRRDEPVLTPAVAAKLVNRDTQIYDLKEAGKLSLVGAAGTAARHPAIIALGTRDDLPTLLHERFCDYDGRLCFTAARARTANADRAQPWYDDPVWSEARMQVRSGQPMKLADFRRYLDSAFDDLLAVAPLRDMNGQTAIVPFLHVSEKDIRGEAAAIVGHWIERWDRELETPVDVPLLPSLYITHDPGDGGFLGRLFGGGDACAAIREAVTRAAPQRLDPILLADFEDVGLDETEDWLHEIVRPTAYFGEVRDAVARLFGERNARHKMWKFYHDLIASPPFARRGASRPGG